MPYRENGSQAGGTATGHVDVAEKIKTGDGIKFKLGREKRRGNVDKRGRRYYGPDEWPTPEQHPAAGISRTEYRNAWHAAIGHKRQHYSKSFADGVYGSRELSLAAAIGWRESMEKKFKIRSGKRRWKHGRLAPNGAGSVGRYEHDGHGPRWRAGLTTGGICLQRDFYVHIHGEAEAERLAHAMVAAWQAELTRRAVYLPPGALAVKCWEKYRGGVPKELRRYAAQ